MHDSNLLRTLLGLKQLNHNKIGEIFYHMIYNKNGEDTCLNLIYSKNGAIKRVFYMILHFLMFYFILLFSQSLKAC